MILRIKAPGFPICLSCVFLLFSAIAHSQQKNSSPDIDLSKRPIKFILKARGFADVITMLSIKLGLNILADDEPLTQDVTLEFDGNASEALNQVSEAFDYTWRQKPGGIIVMYKQFHNVAEHPQYNLPEVRRMAHDVVNIFKAVPSAIPANPDDDFTARTSAFFSMLTPPQVDMLRAGKMLSGSELNAQQGEALQIVILRNMFFDQVLPWQELMVELDGLERSQLQMRETRPFATQGMPKEAVLKTPIFLQLLLSLKATDGTKFVRSLTSMQSAPSIEAEKKP